MLLAVFAVLFVISLFLLNSTSVFKNEKFAGAGSSGLSYDNEILGDVIERDSDEDGIQDWEESLWGTDPTKKDTNDDGVRDDVEIQKMKLAGAPGEAGAEPSEESLTETDKFSREFFSTVATLTQAGEMDQATVDQLSASLAEHIQNSPPKKIYTILEIKIQKDDSAQAVKNYDAALEAIYKKYPFQKGVVSVLEEFWIDENNVNAEALAGLDPLIEQTSKIIGELTKTNVPQSLAPLHLEFVNGFERLMENMEDMKLYDSDPILALAAISQYEKNITALEEIVGRLANAVKARSNS